MYTTQGSWYNVFMFKEPIMHKIIPLAQKALNYIWTPYRLRLTLCLIWTILYGAAILISYFMGRGNYSTVDIFILVIANYYVGTKVREYVASKFPNDVGQS